MVLVSQRYNLAVFWLYQNHILDVSVKVQRWCHGFLYCKFFLPRQPGPAGRRSRSGLGRSGFPTELRFWWSKLKCFYLYKYKYRKKEFAINPIAVFRTLHCGHCRTTLEGLSILYKARFKPPKCSRNRVDPERNDAGCCFIALPMHAIVRSR
jgi:hypothetical protein